MSDQEKAELYYRMCFLGKKAVLSGEISRDSAVDWVQLHHEEARRRLQDIDHRIRQALQGEKDGEVVVYRIGINVDRLAHGGTFRGSREVLLDAWHWNSGYWETLIQGASDVFPRVRPSESHTYPSGEVLLLKDIGMHKKFIPEEMAAPNKEWRGFTVHGESLQDKIKHCDSHLSFLGAYRVQELSSSSPAAKTVATCIYHVLQGVIVRRTIENEAVYIGGYGDANTLEEMDAFFGEKM